MRTIADLESALRRCVDEGRPEVVLDLTPLRAISGVARQDLAELARALGPSCWVVVAAGAATTALEEAGVAVHWALSSTLESALALALRRPV